MKKALIFSLVFLLSFTTFGIIFLATPSTILYLLNWGEYIDKDLVSLFEKEFNCQVIEEDVTSSEAMYQKITSKTTSYDVAIPGDYTVHQLYNEGYLLQLDVSNSSYQSLNNYKSIFSDGLTSIIDEYMVDDKGEEFSSYFMPYFWGSYSLLYSKSNPETEKVIKEKGFEALWNREEFSFDVKIGMYDSARWILSSYLMGKGYDPNITSYDGKKENDLSNEIKNDCIASLKSNKFNEFGNDSLKRNVANSSLDFCYTQSGDFFDALYLSYSESNKDVNFDIYVPKNTAAFFDSMVIPSTTQNYELANKFIDFMLRKDIAYQNARSIGYSPTLKSVVSSFEENAKNGEYYYEDDEKQILLSDFLTKYPYYLNPLYGVNTTYVLEPKSREYLTTCETILNSIA